jgi:hypothetical protein
MTDKSVLLEKFESLGDNCEFGFLQRKFGLEPGGLLRWAISSPSALSLGLGDRFANTFLFDNLLPSADDMVRDNAYGIYFHSMMRSNMRDGVREFRDNVEKRQAIYKDEYEKIRYLTSKLIEQLEDATKIFVYKRNSGVSCEAIVDLKNKLTNFNSRCVLFVVSQNMSGVPVGHVSEHSPGLLIGAIDRFAPYERADDISADVWLELCEKAAALASVSQSEA